MTNMRPPQQGQGWVSACAAAGSISTACVYRELKLGRSGGRRNAHGIAEHELLYPWHPWAGCLVHIHAVVQKAGREIFRCSLSGRASARWLEIPSWMFDWAARAAWRVGAAPYVDLAVLTALATLLQDVTSVSGTPSQLRDSSAALGSHDANRGDVHAAPAYCPSPSSQQCTSVRSVLRPAHRRGGDAAMAGGARRDAT